MHFLVTKYRGVNEGFVSMLTLSPPSLCFMLLRLHVTGTSRTFCRYDCHLSA